MDSRLSDHEIPDGPIDCAQCGRYIAWGPRKRLVCPACRSELPPLPSAATPPKPKPYLRLVRFSSGLLIGFSTGIPLGGWLVSIIGMS